MKNIYMYITTYIVKKKSFITIPPLLDYCQEMYLDLLMVVSYRLKTPKIRQFKAL